RDRMPLIGREITYLQSGQEKNARVTGVANDGGLIVITDGKEEILRSGEISLGSYSFSGLE
ncbi:MAG: bifunctional biotin--[Clostridia bacterium]|nr:bifunctional biotin--[acetyl-CoA-carboxylase] synthetase/biotin operon repressor [Clostridia bacterium]